MASLQKSCASTAVLSASGDAAIVTCEAQPSYSNRSRELHVGVVLQWRFVCLVARGCAGQSWILNYVLVVVRPFGKLADPPGLASKCNLFGHSLQRTTTHSRCFHTATQTLSTPGHHELQQHRFSHSPWFRHQWLRPA